ncbi:MAG: TetR/AcrR family transcriptional regulator [Candidatus Methanoperedens sp.]|nr:TetR/AcrR family transcriptional regulator [Candidatus Methanoperedens sp.]
MSLREKKKIETRNKIFEVSGRLFKEKGFENTTVDEITKEAGIGKGTFFNYYPTKEALLVDFVKQKEELVYDLVRNELKKNIPVREKIKNVLVLVARSNEKDKEMTRLYVFEYLRHYGYEERKSHSLNLIIHDLLEKSAEKGEVKKGIDIKKAADILTATYFHSLMEWLWSNTDISFSEDISGKIDMIFDGIGGSDLERKK